MEIIFNQLLFATHSHKSYNEIMLPLFTTLALLALLILLLYIYLVWNFGYWKRRGIKEAKSYPFAGSFPSQITQKRNYTYDIDDIYRQHRNSENVVGAINCRTPQLLVLHAELVQKVFIHDFRYFHDNEFSLMLDKKKDQILGMNPFILTGNEWKERRAEVTPGLTTNRIGATYPVTLNVCKAFTKYIAEQMKMMNPQEGLNAKELCLRFTTQVVSDCVLGIDAKSFTTNPTPIYGMIKKVFDHSLGFILYAAAFNLMPQIRHFYSVRFFHKEAENFFYDLMQTCIELRRKSNDTERTDFLNYMLQLQDKKNMNVQLLTSHTMTFLTDGFETTALVLSHLLLLLARHPEVQEQVRQEIANDDIAYEKLNDLPYLEACIHETLRLFPALLVGRKICTESYQFVNKNGIKVQLQPGQVVILPIYSIHHDENHYPQPEAFKPERFLNDGLKKYKEMGCYYGFGDGPRICIGIRFAMVQIKAATVDILRNFNVKVNAKTRTDNYLDETYFLGSLAGGIWLEFEKRN